MNEQNVTLIRNSWELLNVQAGEESMSIFYNTLFEIAPEVKPMFPSDLNDQKRKLASTINFVVKNLTRLDNIKNAVEELGRYHQKREVKAAHYTYVTEALMTTFKTVLKDQFSDEMERSWKSALTILAGIMIAAEEKEAV